MEDARIHELEAKVAELTARIEGLTGTSPAPAAEEQELQRSSRRGMLKLAGAAAVGAAAVAVGGSAMPAAATTGDVMKVGASNTATGDDVTAIIGRVSVLHASNVGVGYNNLAPALVGLNDSTVANTLEHAGLAGIGALFLFDSGTPTAHGVFGYSEGTGCGVVGFAKSGAPGVRAQSASGPAVQLVATQPGAPTSGSWTVGAIVPDTTGRLFYCVASGTPGTWKELTAPSFHPIQQVRVYDSRSPAPTPGKLASGTNRVVSVKDARDPATGGVATADVIPAGTTAVSGNITVTNTSGALGGFLTIMPGDAAALVGSSVNWFGDNQNIANAFIAKVDANRQLKIFAGGAPSPSTDFIIDITGFYF